LSARFSSSGLTRYFPTGVLSLPYFPAGASVRVPASLLRALSSSVLASGASAPAPSAPAASSPLALLRRRLRAADGQSAWAASEGACDGCAEMSLLHLPRLSPPRISLPPLQATLSSTLARARTVLRATRRWLFSCTPGCTSSLALF